MQRTLRPFFLQKLHDEFKYRKSLNRYFSLRQYATFLDLNSGTLSAILAGKRSLPTHKIDSIVKKLNLKGEERKEFLLSLNQPPDDDVLEISLENHSSLYSNKEYLAVLSLFRNKKYSASKKTIANKTGIPLDNLNPIIDRLISEQLLCINEGDVHSVGKNIHFARNNTYVRHPAKHHSHIMISLDERKINLLKRKLQRFWSDVEKLHHSENQGHLYQITLSIAPMSLDKT
ncbi:MAG TPA: hypothetical protein VF412_02440 [Bdellovibrio sp.]|uniref:hypothetical protein n=1 Tax=Bdellovibrio sp. TaxID=28201 RepID=UPI002EE70BB0